jgi:hypothetical protein
MQVSQVILNLFKNSYEAMKYNQNHDKTFECL